MKTSALTAALLLGSTQALSSQEMLQITEGLLIGALQTESLGDYVTCTVTDEQVIAKDLEDAVAQLETKSISGIANGLSDMSDALHTITGAYRLCTSATDMQQLKKVEAMLATFKNPITLAVDVYHNIEMNGSDISAHIQKASTDFAAKDYTAFGTDVGTALAEVSLGQVSALRGESKSADLTEAVDITRGILMGAIQAEGLDNIESCINDTVQIIDNVEVAIDDFKKNTASATLDGLEHLAHALIGIKDEIHDCEGVTADWAKLEAMAAIFASPASFAYHVGKDLIVNGVQIYHDVSDSVTQFDAKSYEPFGEDIGDALAKLILGGADKVQADFEARQKEGLYLF